MNPKIQNLQKQNDAIYSSLVSKNVLFTRHVISDITDETKILDILTEENKELKELSKNNRPAPQVVDKKTVIPVIEKKEPIPKELDEDEESFEDSKKSYTIIHNMEDIKRAFFNKEYESFEELIKQHEFIYYKVSYKYSSDNDRKPDYVARNLLNGFVRSLDDYRKYLLVCFRCKEYEPIKYDYNSLWIVNTKDDLKTIIGSFYDDFDFQLQTFDVENNFLEEFRKKDLEVELNIIGETYIH